MKPTFECSTCGIVTKAKGHLCQPIELTDKGDYCGQPPGHKTARMCADETMRLDYQCGNCGRAAESADLLCNPKKVHGTKA